MKRLHLTTVIATQSVIWLLFAIPLVVAPDRLLPLFGLPAMPVVPRLFGAELVGLALASFITREIIENDKQGYLMFAYFTCNTLGLIVSAAAMWTHQLNVLGWSLVLLYAAYTGAFLVFWWTRRTVLQLEKERA